LEVDIVMYSPLSLLVFSVIVKFLSVASTADSVAHTVTISSPSETLTMAGTDTVTSARMNENSMVMNQFLNYLLSLSVMVIVVTSGIPALMLASNTVSVRVKVWLLSNALSSMIEMSTHLVALFNDPDTNVRLDETGM